MKVVLPVALFAAILLCIISIKDASAGDKYDPKGGYGQGSGVYNRIGIDNNSYATGGNAYGGKAFAQGGQGGNAAIEKGAIQFNPGAVQGGQGGQGGSLNIQPGSVQGGDGGQGGNGQGYGGSSYTNLTGIGNSTSSFRYPVQAPLVLPYGTFWPCGGSFGASGSGGAGGGGFVLPWTFGDCVIFMQSHRMEELHKPKTACQVIVNEYDDVKDAMNEMGETCKEVAATAVALPVANLPPQSTPALDDYVRRKELNDKLDNYDRTHNQK